MGAAIHPYVFKLVECEQGSLEWFLARAGAITASMIKVIRKRLQNGEWSVAAKKYAFRLAFERLAGGVLDDTYSNAYMKRGNTQEAVARQLHEIEVGEFVEETGFWVSSCGRFGASPDGLIGLDGGGEYKCFLSPDELMPIMLEGDTSTVMDQVQMCMLATGRQWWDFFLYMPQLAKTTEKPYLRHRIERNDAYIAQMMAELEEFDSLVNSYGYLLAEKLNINAFGAEPAYQEQEFDFVI
jgi:hypothetical protein